MITFKQKNYSKEADAMKAFYEVLKRERKRVEVIDSNSLIPVLKGNNIVIERFVIFSPTFGKDRYRMYLKVGAKAKMPENLVLAGQYVKRDNIFNTSIKFEGGLKRRKLFSKKGNNNNNNDPGNFARAGIELGRFEIGKDTTKRLGETIMYDVKSRSVVLEFPSIENAVRALDILPFGLNYKMYLLDV